MQAVSPAGVGAVRAAPAVADIHKYPRTIVQVYSRGPPARTWVYIMRFLFVAIHCYNQMFSQWRFAEIMILSVFAVSPLVQWENQHH